MLRTRHVGRLITMLCAIAIVSSAAFGQEQGNHRIGGGAHYWRTIDQIKDDKSFDSDGLSWLVSYQYAFSLLKIELGAEIFPNGYYGSKEVTVSPQAFIGLSTIIYAALGIGTAIASDLDQTFADPFFIAKAGLDLEILPNIRLDLNVNYYFTSFDGDAWDHLDTDTITLGGQVRFAF